MKGLFFKSDDNHGYKIISEPVSISRHGRDELVIVGKNIQSNKIKIFHVANIDTVEETLAGIGYNPHE